MTIDTVDYSTPGSYESAPQIYRFPNLSAEWVSQESAHWTVRRAPPTRNITETQIQRLTFYNTMVTSS